MKEERFPHARKPLHWRRPGLVVGNLQSHRGEHSNRGADRKVRDSHTGVSADQHSTALEACLLTHQGGWGLGAEAQALEVRPQGEDWGGLHEHSLNGVSVPQLAVRESGKKSGTA